MSKEVKIENKAKSSGKHYLTGKEIREISRANAYVMKALEKKKERLYQAEKALDAKLQRFQQQLEMINAEEQGVRQQLSQAIQRTYS